MSDADLYLSRGDCYYGEGQISDPRFLPCGNAEVSGTQACCYQGDFCLETNVCYDNDTAVTYITGCTDPTFSSSKCPHKPGYPDQQWVALARCDGDDIDLFSGCGHHRDAVEIEHEDCTCDAASALISNPAHGEPTLAQIGLLPTTAGGTISFNPTALPTATSGSDSDSGGGGGLSTGAKAGIGVGVGVGVPLIAGLIFLFIWLQRKKKARKAPPEPIQTDIAPQRETFDHYAAAQQMQQQHSPPPMYSPDSQNAHDGWLRYKPELHGNSAHKSELPADAPPGNDTLERNNSNNYNHPSSIQNTPHENYPPSELSSEYAESRRGETPSFISPQSTGSTQPGRGGGGHGRTESSNMSPISEHFIDR